jgi:hypothetical protein
MQVDPKMKTMKKMTFVMKATAIEDGSPPIRNATEKEEGIAVEMKNLNQGLNERYLPYEHLAINLLNFSKAFVTI